MKIRSFIRGIACCVLTASAVFAQNQPFPFSGVVHADRVNVRAGQNKNFEAVGTLQKGDPVVVIDQSYSWYKIRLPEGAQCHVSRKLVQVLREDIGEISGDRVNIRARPAAESSILGQLSKATKVRILETTDEWYRIEPLEGLHGWVLADLVAFQSEQVPPVKVVQLPPKNMYLQKRQEKERQLAEEEQKRLEYEERKVAMTGTVAVIPADAPGVNVRHQITAEDGRTFYLMAYRSVLDGFLNHRVNIEGLPQEESSGDHPVVLVTKVVLVL